MAFLAQGTPNAAARSEGGRQDRCEISNPGRHVAGPRYFRMTDTLPQGLKRSGNDPVGRDRALLRLAQRQTAAQIDHRETQRQGRLQLSERLGAATPQLPIVDFEHRLDSFLVAITEYVVARLAA